MAKRLTQEEFTQRCKVIHPQYDYSQTKYKGGHIKISVLCPIHGSFTVLASNHLFRQSGCPLCANKIRNINSTKTHAQFLHDLDQRNLKFTPVFLWGGGKYSTAKQKQFWYCKENHKWSARASDILNGSGCPRCAIKKREQTNLTRYGVNYITQSLNTSKLYDTINDKEWLHDQHSIKGKTLDRIAQELGVSFTAIKSRFTKFNLTHKKFSRSQFERDFETFINRLPNKPSFIANTHHIINKELDFFFTEYNVAIELNGIFWHSELNGRHRKYHIDKTTQCKDKRISLLQIWETEWLTKRDIIMSKVKVKTQNVETKIYARNCKMKIVDANTACEFFNRTHIQGSISSPINIAATYCGNIVAIMSFSKSRFNKTYQYELTRFSSELNTIVVGIGSRLMNYFLKYYDPDTIVSYCDLRYGTGKLYKKIGFTYSHTSSPNYFYFHRSNDKVLFSRQSFQKHKLKVKLQLFDPNLSEWENMQLNGYDRIWDCGNDVWVWNKC